MTASALNPSISGRYFKNNPFIKQLVERAYPASIGD
jgi:hypothetical protein